MTIYDEFYQKTKDYTRNELIIELIKKYSEKRELIDYLKEQIKLCKKAQRLALENKMIEQVGSFNLRIAIYNEILSKIEKD